MKVVKLFLIFKLIKMLLNVPISLIAKIIPKNDNLSIIGSSLGEHFSDNSKYFYIYFHKLKKDKKNKLLWITKNKELVEFLQSHNLPVEYLYSVKGIYATVTARKVFLSHQLNDIYGALIWGATIIQLWHGFPLKKIGYNGDWNSDTSIGKIKYFLYKIMPFNYYMSCNKLIVPSILVKENFKEAFTLSFNSKESYKDIIVLGQPRNDIFESNYKFNDCIFPEIKLLKEYKNTYNHIISWLPTQRKALNKTIADLITESELNLQKLDNFCNNLNILFIFKPHFLDIGKLEKKINKYKNLVIYDAADPYPLLKYTDILITDYSSVYFDFLLTKKPIIFAPFDYKEYLSIVNFYHNYDKTTPGVKCYTWENILRNITLIINDKDEYVDERELFLKKLSFNKNSSTLVYNTFFRDKD